MARIRSIKPEFFVSEQVADVSTTSRLLFVGLWVFCDDAGRHPASCKQLKMEIFPGDPFTVDQIRGWVAELIETGLLIEYEVECDAQVKSYWQVTGWNHQKIEKPRTRYPGPEEGKIRQKFDDHSGTSPVPVDDCSGTRSPTTGDDRKGVYKKGADLSSSSRDDGNAILGLWNDRAAECPSLAAVRKLTKGRAEKLKTRMADPEFRDNFREALKKLPIPNDERFSWQPSFDWILANDTNLFALLEGKFDRNGAAAGDSAAEAEADFYRKKALEGLT